MRKIELYWATLLFAVGVTVPSMAGATEKISVRQPCTSSEQWHWPLPAETETLGIQSWIPDFERTISPSGSKVRGFSEGLALRRLAKNNRERALSEYWISRVLFDAGMIHLAERGFRSLLQHDVTLATGPFQLAAVGCLSEIHKNFSAIPMDGGIVNRLKQMEGELSHWTDKPSELKPIIWEMAFYQGLNGAKDSRGILELLKGSGPYELFYKGVIHLDQAKYSEGIEDLKAFFVASQGSDRFRTLMDRAHLLIARALYSVGKYKEALSHFQLVGIRSNERVHALSGLAWTFLMEDDYRGAIGIGVGLQSGGFKNSFAPEVLMVMAMALNEMCQFPESISVIHSFRKNYRDSYFWLKEHTDEKSHKQLDFYKMAIKFAKRAPEVQIPTRVASEWIRSPVFLANQDRINLLFKEKSRADELEKQGRSEQRVMRTKLLKDVKELRAKFKLAKINLKPGEELSRDWMDRLKALKKEWAHYRRLRNAGPVWKKMLSNYQAKVPQIQAAMVTGVNQEISNLNQSMRLQLDEIAENNELIEVEIYNGASEDIVWQNAHPGYKEAAKTMDHSSPETAVEKVWNWGSVQGGLEGQSEIWEDEVGGLSANITDNCESKDKYLSIQRGKRR